MADYVDLMDPGFRKHFQARQLRPVDATPTPLATWNASCRDDGGKVGLAKGWFVVIAGNPKFGKSILALNLAARAMQAGEHVCFVSLEMSAEQLAARLYAMLTKTSVHMLEKGGFTPEHFEQVWKRMAPLANDYEFSVNATPIVQLDEILADMRAHRENGVRWFVVDYLQLVGIGDEQQIHKQVSLTTSHLRWFAQETDSTVIALSQFNNETAKNYRETPRVQGCYGGIYIAATCDQAVLIDHSRYAKQDGKAKNWLVVDVNRHGDAGPIPIEWDYRTLGVREAEPDEEHEWPKH